MDAERIDELRRKVDERRQLRLKVDERRPMTLVVDAADIADLLAEAEANAGLLNLTEQAQARVEEYRREVERRDELLAAADASELAKDRDAWLEIAGRHEERADRAEKALAELLSGGGLCKEDCRGHCGFGGLHGCAAIKEYLADVRAERVDPVEPEPTPSPREFRTCGRCATALLGDEHGHCRQCLDPLKADSPRESGEGEASGAAHVMVRRFTAHGCGGWQDEKGEFVKPICDTFTRESGEQLCPTCARPWSERCCSDAFHLPRESGEGGAAPVTAADCACGERGCPFQPGDTTRDPCESCDVTDQARICKIPCIEKTDFTERAGLAKPPVAPEPAPVTAREGYQATVYALSTLIDGVEAFFERTRPDAKPLLEACASSPKGQVAALVEALRATAEDVVEAKADRLALAERVRAAAKAAVQNAIHEAISRNDELRQGPAYVVAHNAAQAALDALDLSPLLTPPEEKKP